jgi:nucleoside-diphosphate-sugar epimerase
MKIFVAGAAGVVGRRVVPMLAGRGEAPGRPGARPVAVDLFDLTRAGGRRA